MAYGTDADMSKATAPSAIEELAAKMAALEGYPPQVSSFHIYKHWAELALKATATSSRAELLAALREIEGAGNSGFMSCDDTFERGARTAFDRCAKIARAALAKAEERR